MNVCKKNTIRIGCIELSFEEWEKQAEEIGKKYGYTTEQITEYKMYIKLAIELEKLYPTP